MNLEAQKKNFKGHVATFTDFGNIKILDFQEPGSSHYRIRFLFEEDFYKLHISGDLGNLTATNYCNMRYDKFAEDFSNNVGYFLEKINCHDRDIYAYDEDEAKKDLLEYINDNDLQEEVLAMYDLTCHTFEDAFDEFFDDVMVDFDDSKGISQEGFEKLEELDSGAWEWAGSIGKYSTGIIELYLLAFRLAQEQLNTK